LNGIAQSVDDSGSLVGSRVGPYVIEERLGQGGMAVVHAALHVELGTRYAIKVVRPEVTYMPAGIDRFRQEAKLASKLGDRLLLEVFDFGTLPDGRPYFVMPLLQGESVRQVLRRGEQWSVARIVAAFSGTAKALDKMHQKGLLHRDIKPDNLFLTVNEHTGDEEIVVVDFGLATFFEKASKLTRPGVLLGTPAYMAPELAVKDFRDPSVDIYALAVVLYELLVGRRPYGERDAHRLMQRRLLEDPTPPSGIRRELGPEVDEFFARALSRHALERFGSCQSLIAAFADLRDSDPGPVEGTPSGSVSRSERVRTDHHERQRLRRRVMVGAVIALALMGLAVHYVLRDPAPESTPGSVPSTPAVESPAPSFGPAAEPEGPADEVDESPVDAPAGPDAPSAERVSDPVVQPALEPAPAPAAERAARPARRSLAQRPGAETAPPPPTASEEPPPLGPLLAAGRSALAGNRTAEAVTAYRRATRTHPSSVDAWLGLAMASRAVGDRTGARRALEHARALAPERRAAIDRQLTHLGD